MKYSLFLSLMILTAPVVGNCSEEPIFQETLFESQLSVLPKELSSKLYEANTLFASYIKANPEAIKTAHLFCGEVLKSYIIGEGLVSRDLETICHTMIFTAKKYHHHFIKRSYVNDPMSVVYHMFTVGRVRDLDALCAAILYKTVEDTNTTVEEIGEKFGARIESFVREVVEDPHLSKEEIRKKEIATAPYKSAGASQILLSKKYCDVNILMTSPPIGMPKNSMDAYVAHSTFVINTLPWVNGPLKKVLEEITANYWSQHS